MSRSRKRTPIYKYAPSSKRNGARKAKRMANKKVRRSLNLINGKKYKRFYPQYDVHDVVSFRTWADSVNSYYANRIELPANGFLMNAELDFNRWARYYLRK